MYSDKYEIEFTDEQIKSNVQRLTNQLWKLIPMREHNENWQKQLETVLIEIAGLNELFTSPIILQLLIETLCPTLHTEPEHILKYVFLSK